VYPAVGGIYRPLNASRVPAAARHDKAVDASGAGIKQASADGVECTVTYFVSWDGPSAQQPKRGHEVAVSTTAHVDAVLKQVAAQAAIDEVPSAVQIHRPRHDGAIMIGVGHPTRSFIDWLDRSQPHGTGDRSAVDTDLPNIEQSIGFDVYGNWSEMPPPRTRITPQAARAAAHEYLETGQRPTGVEWVSR
jgi:hypothetical protein